MNINHDNYIDPFSLFINFSGNINQATMSIVNILLAGPCKIHIVDFSGFCFDSYLAKRKEELGSKIEESLRNICIVKDIQVSREWLEEYTSQLETDDILFVNGIEALLERKEKYEKNAVKVTIGTRYMWGHLSSEENWQELFAYLDKYYSNYQDKICGIFSVINTDFNAKNIIDSLKDLTNYMSILTLEHENMDMYNQLSGEILSSILNSQSNLVNILKKIEDNTSILGEHNTAFLKALAYQSSGDIQNAITILQSISKNLESNQLMFLAELLIIRNIDNDKEDAEKILTSIYSNNKFAKGLFPAFYRLYVDNKEKLYHYVTEGMKYTPNDSATIEQYASMLSFQEKYTDAAYEFRKLAKNEDYPYYELIAKINKLISEDNPKNIIDIKEHIKKYPTIKNKALLRLAKYFIKHKKSYYLAYKYLCEAELIVDDKKSVEIINLKIDILKDEQKASKALGKLKPYKKQSDADKLNTARVNLFIESVKILPFSKNPYLVWRKLLESQSSNTWLKNTYIILKKVITALTEENVPKLLSNSFATKIDNAIVEENRDIEAEIENGHSEKLELEILKAFKYQMFAPNSFGVHDVPFDEHKSALLSMGEILDSNTVRIWGRFYLSIYAAKCARGQDANNLAIDLFEHIERVDSSLQKLTAYLGLLAWSNAQYRLGDKVEGIFCLFGAIELGLEIQEIQPTIEFGFNLIGRLLTEEYKEEFKNETLYWKSISEKINKVNTSFDRTVTNNIENLTLRIQEEKVKDINWAIDVSNLICLHVESNKLKEAYNVLEEYCDEIFSLLEQRKDVFYNIMYSWSQIYLFSIKYSINNLYKALHFSNLSVKAINEVRTSFFHKEERGGFGDIISKIYRNHLNIYIIVLDMSQNNNTISYYKMEILNFIHNLLPKTILEQKKHNQQKQLTPALEKLMYQHNFAIDEHNAILRRNSDNHEILELKKKEIVRLTTELKLNHPHMQSLKSLSPINFDKISSLLSEKEICHQYIIVNYGVLEIIIEKNNVSLFYNKCDIIELNKDILTFSSAVQSDSSDSIIEVVKRISKCISNNLMKSLEKKEYTTLFSISDLKGKLFPISAITTETASILDLVNNIINIVDYESLKTKPSAFSVTGIYHKILGSEHDPEISKIIRWCNSYESENVTVEVNGDFEYISTKKTNVNTIIIYGHGVSDPNENIFYGAHGIEGKGATISFEEISSMVTNYTNVAIISCRGGIPDYDKFDNFYGIWSSIFEKFSGGIILCKWDVNTSRTLEILGKTFDSCLNDGKILSEALLSVQKELKSNTAIHQWAGIEFWLN